VAKLSTLQDPFTAAAINTTLWNNITVGTATLDTVNDTVNIAVPTASGTTNTFGTNNLYDATNSSVYAQIGAAANGGGNTGTIIRVRFDTNNNVAMRNDAGLFRLRVINAGVTTTVTVADVYDPHLHRWWRIRESGGTFYAGTSPDGFTWTEQTSLPHTWGAGATTVTCRFEATASAAEIAGSVVQVSNVNTLAGGPYNLAWPRTEDGWGPFWNANQGTVPPDRYVDVGNLTNDSMTFNRGRQYELDQVRAGEGQFGLLNTDAAFEPTNTSGPWFGHVKPYEPFRRRAQWPATRNLLTQVQATGGDLGGFPTGPIPNDARVTGETGPGSILATASAWQGGRVFDFPVAAGAGGNAVIFGTAQPAADPGTTYTHTVRVRNVAASGTLQIKPYIAWYTAGVATATAVDGGTVALVGSVSADWTTLTITATAPANVAGIEIGVRAASETPDARVQADGWQLEQGSASTVWTCPGEWYPVFSGFLERWPSKWDMAGTFGKVQPTVVDAFALLSQVELDDPLTEEINSSSPRFLYKLDDPSGSLSATDATGNFPAVPIAISKYGAGSLTFGNSITATDAVNGIFTGAPGPVVTINNANPGQNTTSAASFLRLAAAGITGPADPSRFTRAIAFRYTGPTPTVAACLWSSMDNQRANGNPSGSRIYLYLLPDGKAHFFMTDQTGTTLVNVTCGPANCVDGNWHLVTFGYWYDTGAVTVSVDGVITATGIVPQLGMPTGIVGDNLGGFVDITVGNGTTWNYKGDIAFAGEWPSLLGSVQITNLYEAWKNACEGDTTDQRYARILRYAGYTGPSTIQTGLTTSMGPANIAGQDAVSALQNVVTTENGEHFIDRSGAPRFRARSARYNATTPAFTFGERADLGEWPYENAETDYDTTHLANDVSVAQEPTGQVFYAKDAGSTADYFPRPMDRTINSTSGPECQDAANYLLSRYRQPLTRISTIKLHPAAIPALWPVCLSLELGMRVRVIRRAPGVPAVQVDCFVEKIDWDFGDDNEAWVTLQCSPADPTPYGVFAAWHTPLASASAVGATSLTINAPQVTQLYSATFDTAGTWRIVTGSGTDVGPITVASDAGTTAARATASTVLEDLTEIPYDPTLTYRVSATLRTATAPTVGSPLVYVGLTGITADGKRCNINGTNTVSAQHYAAARAAQPPSTYTTYTGYVSGTATPSDAGTNPDPANPMRVRPEVVRVRPIVYMLNGATDGLQYMDAFTIHTVPTGGGVPLAAQIAPGQQLVLDQGTAQAETVTVAAVSATSPGWTTGTVTLTAAATKAHPVGAVICEPLPAGTTDPATWDAVAKFDFVTFAY
jgi:hypothetical protein